MAGPKIDRGTGVQHADPQPSKEAKGPEKSTKPKGADQGEGKSGPTLAQKEREASSFQGPEDKGPVNLDGGVKTRPGDLDQIPPDSATRSVTRKEAEEVLNQSEEGKKVLAELADLEANHQVKVSFESDPDLVRRGQWTPEKRLLQVNTYYSSTPREAALTLVHEVEHAHQTLGTKPDSAGPNADPDTPGMNRDRWAEARVREEAHAEARSIDVANELKVETPGSGRPLQDIYNKAYAARNGTPEENRQAGIDAMHGAIMRGDVWPHMVEEHQKDWDRVMGPERQEVGT